MFRLSGYALLCLLHGLMGCGQVSRDGTSSADVAGGSGGGAGAGAAGPLAGSGGATGKATLPVTSCPAYGYQATEPVAEICSAGERCCNCGCGPDRPECNQEQPGCPRADGPSCGTESCRSGYVCCNAICGDCARTFEECTAIPGRCEAVGLDPSFERCAHLRQAGVPSAGIGPLEDLLLKLRGRWLLCGRDESVAKEDVIAGIDVTSDGRFFMLTRNENVFSRLARPETQGMLRVPGGSNLIGELDFLAENGATQTVLLFFAFDPGGLWMLPAPAPQGSGRLGGVYLNDPNEDVE